MRSLKICVLLAILFCIFCAATSYAARLVSTMTCGDVNPQGMIPIAVQDEFATTAPAIHLVAVMSDVAKAARVKAVWMSVNAIEVPNFAIDSTEVVANEPESRLHFQLSRPNNGWPAGDYQVLLYVDDTFVTSVPFKVAAKSEPVRAESVSPTLIGCWRCEDAGESSLIEFREDNVMLYDGDAARYSKTSAAIQMETEFGPIEYPYSLSGNLLTLEFPGGYQLRCTRTGCSGAPRSAPQDYGDYDRNEYAPQPSAPQSSGNESLLSGQFCHWGGSSSSYTGSSYSHSERVYFDGQGRFTTGSEASFNSPEGLAYGGGNDGGGTYRVVGNEVHLMFTDGSTGVATVYNRGQGGRVTELMYNGDLYAPQLCE